MFRRRRSNRGKQHQTGELIEYLYVDEQRLNNYFEQVSSPTAFDKVPAFGATFGLAGPSASVSGNIHAREFTKHEKITALTSYLESKGFIEEGRPAYIGPPDEHRRVFRSEKCRGTQVFVPLPDKDRPLVLWICDPPREGTGTTRHWPIGFLYLIQDFQPSDFPETGMDRGYITYSSFSALEMLLEQTQETALKGRLERTESPRELSHLFATKPIEVIERLNGAVGTTREIEALYRVRATMADEGVEATYAVATVAYPIVISEPGTS